MMKPVSTGPGETTATVMADPAGALPSERAVHIARRDESFGARNAASQPGQSLLSKRGVCVARRDESFWRERFTLPAEGRAARLEEWPPPAEGGPGQREEWPPPAEGGPEQREEWPPLAAERARERDESVGDGHEDPGDRGRGAWGPGAAGGLRSAEPVLVLVFQAIRRGRLNGLGFEGLHPVAYRTSLGGARRALVSGVQLAE